MVYIQLPSLLAEYQSYCVWEQTLCRASHACKWTQAFRRLNCVGQTCSDQQFLFCFFMVSSSKVQSWCLYHFPSISLMSFWVNTGNSPDFFLQWQSCLYYWLLLQIILPYPKIDKNFIFQEPLPLLLSSGPQTMPGRNGQAEVTQHLYEPFMVHMTSFPHCGPEFLLVNIPNKIDRKIYHYWDRWCLWKIKKKDFF